MTEFVKTIVQLPHGSDPSRGPGWTELYVRDDTADNDVINEVFVLDVYHLRGLQLKPTPPAQLAGDGSLWTPRIIDLGACSGIFSALACQMFPTARVLAIEPDPDNFALLKMNTKKWPDRVEHYNAAIGSDQRFVLMEGEGATGHTLGMADPDNPGAVEQITLEQCIAGQMVALLKIDVEGAEYATLDACPIEAMRRVDQIAMEWHGPEMCPWVGRNGTNIQYGDMLHKLAVTHAVTVFGRPDRGGMLYAHRYPD